ncbi:MAG: 50S ribosomal protein L25 [Planctomycetaceae bacterium]
MAEDFRLSAQPRTQLGSLHTRRLRKQGQVPANLYGFKKDAVNIAVSAEQVEKMVAAGSRVVDVELDGNVEKATVQELQWDIYSTHVKHVDLQRVDPEAVATVDVPLQLRGEPLGLKDGGQLRQAVKKVTVTCPAFRVPPYIVVRVGALRIGDSVRVSDLQAPETVNIDTEGARWLWNCSTPKRSLQPLSN